MATSSRRLLTTPSRRRQLMELRELIRLFEHHHRAHNRSADTIRHYQDSLRLCLRCLEQSGIPATTESLTNATMATFAEWLRATPIRPWRGQTQRSIWGVHGALKDIKIFVKWLAEEGHIARAPKVPVPTLPKRLFPVLTDAELAQVFACKQLADGSEIAIRNRALVAMLLDTGMRLSEIAGLTYEDVNLRDGSAKVTGKGDKQRIVFFQAGAAEALRRWLSIRGEEEGSLFWLTNHGVRMLLKRIKDETGLPVLHAHQFRHTAFTMMVRGRMPLALVQRIAGHASITTTESYLALADEDVREGHKTASPFDRIQSHLDPPPPAGRRRLKTS
ncbi:MAG: tyrosine-type recombinase/integrase [Thermomicrobiales bacterium]